MSVAIFAALLAETLRILLSLLISFSSLAVCLLFPFVARSGVLESVVTVVGGVCVVAGVAAVVAIIVVAAVVVVAEALAETLGRSDGCSSSLLLSSANFLLLRTNLVLCVRSALFVTALL